MRRLNKSNRRESGLDKHFIEGHHTARPSVKHAISFASAHRERSDTQESDRINYFAPGVLRLQPCCERASVMRERRKPSKWRLLPIARSHNNRKHHTSRVGIEDALEWRTIAKVCQEQGVADKHHDNFHRARKGYICFHTCQSLVPTGDYSFLFEYRKVRCQLVAELRVPGGEANDNVRSVFCVRNQSRPSSRFRRRSELLQNNSRQVLSNDTVEAGDGLV